MTVDLGIPTKGVRLAAPRGYCAGVDRAVITVEKALDLYGAPVYVRKQIVHNKHVVSDLESRGAVFVEELDEVPEGATVVFSAHGVSPTVHEEAKARGLKTIDATCPLVTKVHHEAKRFAGDDYDILLIGHAGHEEVEGTSGEAPEHIQLVQGPGDVADIVVRDPAKVAWLSQTTLSVDETLETVDAIRAALPRAARPAERRHLLRHAEPPARGQGDRPRRRPGDRGRLGELLELRPAGRGGPRGRCQGRPPGRRRVARSTRPGSRASTRSASPRARACPRRWSTGVLRYLTDQGYPDAEAVHSAEESLIFALPPELRRDLRARRVPGAGQLADSGRHTT